MNQIANAHFDVGQWRKADQYYRQARAIFEQMGDVYNRAIADNNLGGIALNQGRLDEALGFYESAVSAVEQIGESVWIQGVFHMNLGATRVRRLHGSVQPAPEDQSRSRGSPCGRRSRYASRRC